MKELLTIAVILLCVSCMAQRITRDEWNEEEKTNIRLRPKFGYAQRTEIQKKIDEEFIASTLLHDTTPRKASDHLIKVGFSYLSRDLRTAMYRFNQAYLIDSTNSDVYWGFGSVYMTLGDFERAEVQYVEGLKLDPGNTRLLTNFGANFLAQFYAFYPTDKEKAHKALDLAVTILLRSFKLDSKNQVTSFKLSVCFWNKDNCDQALKFYDICKSLGGKPITADYTRALDKKCRRKKR